MQPQDDPEVKYKMLINIGVGFSILLIVGIFITIIVTRQKMKDDDFRLGQVAVADSLSVIDTVGYSYDDYYSDPGDYYEKGAGNIERENDSLRTVINSNYPGSDKKDLLKHLETQGDYCAQLCQELATALQDTISKPGVSGSAVSADFFTRTQRDEALFSALFSYRETTEELAPDAGIYDMMSYRDYLPLRERSTYSYIKTWNESEFEKDPIDVLTYLKDLEMDVRYYENQVLWDMVY